MERRPSMEYILHILIMICIYCIIGMSLNLVAGYAGLVSIAHAGFFGIGAYTAALLSVTCNLSFPSVVLIAMVVSILTALPISYLLLRVRDDMFAIATFGLQLIFFGIMNNWIGLTRGPNGISGVSYLDIIGLQVRSRLDFFMLALILAGLVFIALTRIVRSPFGAVLRAARDDEVLAQSLGKNTPPNRMAAFSFAAAMASIAGTLYAYYMTFVDPTSFTVQESIFMVSIVIVGGAGNLKGSIVGAILLTSMPEIIRFIGIPGPAAANLRQIIYGILLILFMVFRPKGIIGEYGFGKED